MTRRRARIMGYLVQGLIMGTLLFLVIGKLYCEAKVVLNFRYQGF